MSPALSASRPAGLHTVVRLGACAWWVRAWALALAGVALAGCASLPAEAPDPRAESSAPVAEVPAPGVSPAPAQIARSPWAAEGTARPWEHMAFPGKRATRFRYEWVAGRPAVQAEAQSSASLLRQHLRVEPAALGEIHFSWRVPALIAEADMSLREKDDTPVRIVLAFDGDRSRFSARDAMLAELSRMVTGEEMPYATLMYVWSKHKPVGSVIASPRTQRIRKLVVESGPGNLGRWVDHVRDIRADFERAFGETPGALVGVAIMTDTDNTRSRARAWYGPVSLHEIGGERASLRGR